MVKLSDVSHNVSVTVHANPWKIVAVIFIVLFVLETVAFIWFFSFGTRVLSNDVECSVNICGQMEGVTSYIYDSYESICYCYSGDEIVKEQYLRLSPSKE